MSLCSSLYLYIWGQSYQIFVVLYLWVFDQGYKKSHHKSSQLHSLPLCTINPIFILLTFCICWAAVWPVVHRSDACFNVVLISLLLFTVELDSHFIFFTLVCLLTCLLRSFHLLEDVSDIVLIKTFQVGWVWWPMPLISMEAGACL